MRLLPPTPDPGPSADGRTLTQSYGMWARRNAATFPGQSPETRRDKKTPLALKQTVVCIEKTYVVFHNHIQAGISKQHLLYLPIQKIGIDLLFMQHVRKSIMSSNPAIS